MRGRRYVVLASICALLSALPATSSAKVPHIDVADAARCDFLEPSQCLTPFPDDYYTVADKKTDTGRRVNFALASMPANDTGVHIDPADWNRADGFSPGSTIVLKVPGLDNKQAFKKSHIVPITDMARYKDKSQAVVVIDATTGKRWPVWAEVDSLAPTDKQRNLLIHPQRNFLEGHRYIVALRNLKTKTGKLITAPAAFRVYRDSIKTKQKPVEKRRAHMLSIFTSLGRAGIDPSELYLAWDFTVASERSLSERALHIRDDAFKTLGDSTMADGKPQGHAPAFTVDKVTDFPTPADDPDLLRQVEGTFQVPCYLDSDKCVTGGQFKLDSKGLPQRNTGGDFSARYVCNIPRVAADGRKLQPTLYGHGLFGDIGEARRSRNVHQLGNENGVLVCATDWSGMADDDQITAVQALLDLSNFPKLADRLQEGFLAFMFLGRELILPDGFTSNAAFQVGGQSIIDTSNVAYYGNSQGGILGGALTALSPDVTRSVLYVPGMDYSVLLPRSVDFDDPTTNDDFAFFMDKAYPSKQLRPLLLALIQMLWDRGEPDGYAQHMTTDPLPNTPAHHVLIEMAFGDHQVANVTAETEARTIGAKARYPTLDPGRSPDVSSQFGLGKLGSLPRDDNGFVVWDIGPVRTQDGKQYGTPAPPTDNLPPSIGQDPHDYVIENSPAIRQQISDYIRPGGKIVDVCSGQPCRTPDWTGPSATP